MGYCIYTGASVMIKDVKAGDVEASNKMQTFLRALKQGTRTCPLLQRSLDIIDNSLHSETPRFAQANGNATADNLTAANYLPAFPCVDFPVTHTFTTDSNLSGMDLESFSLLDSFPEQHVNIDTGEWYLPGQ